MIPKIIHLCWLSGDSYPQLVQRCINSWKEKLPDYEIMLWDTNRFDISTSQWVKEAFENKKYAFAADYIRFYALYNYGGIYLDSDVEVKKSFDPLLDREYILGEEAGGDIEAAVVGAEKGAAWIKACLDHYAGRPFIKKDGQFDMRPVPFLVNDVAKKYNLEILPYQYFSPKDVNMQRIYDNEDTFCIHHFDGKWVKNDLNRKTLRMIHRILYRIGGRDWHNKVIRKLRPFIEVI